MKTAWSLAFLLGWQIIAAADQPQSSPTSGATPVKRAVLIGIAQYLHSSSIPEVPGALNDVELMKDLLVGKFEFDPNDVVQLKNEQAKRDAIFSTIRSHLANLKAGDLAVIQFAGHGSQVADLDGDETDDPVDETIVPWDSRQNSIHDITDDDMNALMHELSANGALVVFILDSCHSATGIRASGRRIPPEKIARRRRSASRGVRGPKRRETYFHQSSADYVLVSACKSDQLAGELTVRGTTYGYLTYYMTQILRSVPEPITYHELLEKIQESDMPIRTSQRPQVEGTRLDAVVFGTETILRQPTVFVEPEGEDGLRARVAAGKAYGIDNGTTLKVFAPGTRDFTQPPIASVRISEAFSDSARAVVESGRVVPHSRAIVDLLQRPYAPVRISITGLEAALRASVAALLTDKESVRIVNGPPFEISAESKDGSVVLRRSDATIIRVVPASATPSLAACAATAILNLGRWLALLALDNPGSPLDVGLSIRKAGDSSRAEVETIKPGEEIEIVVTNRSLVKIFVVLVNLAPNGDVEPLMRESIVDGIEAGKPWPSKAIEAFLPDGQLMAIDHIKAIITTRRISPQVFRLLDCGEREPVPRADEDELERFLRLSAKGERTPPILVDAWAVRSRNFRVERAAQ